jgi:hypothetical protein
VDFQLITKTLLNLGRSQDVSTSYQDTVKGSVDRLSGMPPNNSHFPYRMGIPQQSGTITTIPLFGCDRTSENRFIAPLSGLKISRVNGYGNLELANLSPTGIAIVPLHIGYIQDGAQNHALCRSAFLAPNQRLMFEDACCVQAAQGGYLTEKEQWFFILPLQLRAKALELRAQKNYSKLWEDISELNCQYGLDDRGHLEQIISRQRGFLNQYQNRLELLPQQTGAIFFVDDRFVGLEIVPTAAYFKELWMPLVCFCYGVAAMYGEKIANTDATTITPFKAKDLRELREQLEQSRKEKHQQIHGWLAQTPVERFEIIEEEKFLDLHLKTLYGNNFAGQFVEEKGDLVYASVFAKNFAPKG